MDKTAYCRDKCASSANMLSCMNDCLARPMASAGPVNPFYSSSAPKLFGDMTVENKQVAIVGSVVLIAAIGAGLFFFMKNKKKI